jgi:hypothetical protein
MEELDAPSPSGALGETGNAVLLGFVATPSNSDALVRGVVQAMLDGHRCLVTYGTTERPNSVAVVADLGAIVVDPGDNDGGGEPSPGNGDRPLNGAGDRDGDAARSLNDLQRLLVGAARMRSTRGIVLVPPACDPIDLEASVAALDTAERFAVEADTTTAPREDPDVLVGVPAHDEADTVGDVVARARRCADEVLVVDDGSEDETAAVAREAGATVVEHDRNRGYGSALRTVFAEAQERGTSALVVLDADGQHEPADVPRLVAALEDTDADLVIGSRFAGDGNTDLPAYRWVGLKVINALTNLSMGVVRRGEWVADTQCGFRAYGPEAVESLAADGTISDHMGASTDILHHAHERGYEIAEVGTTVSYEVEDANSQNPVSHGLTLVSNILRTIERERPVTVFGVPGFALSLVGSVLVYWSVVDYVSTRTFSVEIAFVAAFSTLVGLLACFTAIILHSLTVHFDTELSDP